MMAVENLVLGQKVIYERYGFKVGTVTRIGAKTVEVTEEDGHYKEPRVELRYLFPATEENLQRLEDLNRTYEEKQAVVEPYDEKIDLLRNQIRGRSV